MSEPDTSEYDGRVRACLNMGRTMKSRNWTIGESVVVKPGVTDPDTGRDIGGWQGRIGVILGEAEILVKHKHGVNELPLCDLKATEADTETRQLVEDYAVWFANR